MDGPAAVQQAASGFNWAFKSVCTIELQDCMQQCSDHEAHLVIWRWRRRVGQVAFPGSVSAS